MISSLILIVGKIEAAMRDLEKVVCIKFRPKVGTDKQWLNIQRGVGYGRLFLDFL